MGWGGRTLRLHYDVKVFANTEVNWKLTDRSKAVFAATSCVEDTDGNAFASQQSAVDRTEAKLRDR